MKKNKLIISVALTTTLFTSVGTLNQVKVNADNVQQEQTSESLSSSSSLASNSQSNNSGKAIQSKELSKPYIVFGSGCSQKSSVEKVLIGNADSSDFQELTANAQDYNQFINNGQESNTTNASMISSVAVSPADPGSGIHVDIKDFNGEDNITQVTQQQYALAAQMAGVTDVNIVVTSPTQVSGTSALTGVYVALSEDGIKLNSDNTAVANQTLNATQQATQGMNPQDKAKVVQAIGQTSEQIAKDNKNDNPDSQQQIVDLLKKNLDKQGVTVQGNNFNLIVDSLNKFSKAPVANDGAKDYVKNVNNTLDNIKDSVKGNMIKAKDWANANKGWFEKIWDNIKNWFKGLFSHNDENQDNQSSESSLESSSTEE